MSAVIKNHPRFLLLTFENMYFSELLKHRITQPLHLFPTLFSLRRKKQPKYDGGDSASLVPAQVSDWEFKTND